jgi:hypothetical protein
LSLSRLVRLVREEVVAMEAVSAVSCWVCMVVVVVSVERGGRLVVCCVEGVGGEGVAYAVGKTF